MASHGMIAKKSPGDQTTTLTHYTIISTKENLLGLICDLAECRKTAIQDRRHRLSMCGETLTMNDRPIIHLAR